MVSLPEAHARSLQERHAPASACFGCGPANEAGLRLRSFLVGDATEAVWQPRPEHQAFPRILAGGIISTLLDCHSNWTAATYLMRRGGLTDPPVTVTAELHVRLSRPTPSDAPVRLVARALSDESDDRRVVVTARLVTGGEETATSRAVLVAVRPGHPAYGAWSSPTGAATPMEASADSSSATSAGR